MLKVYVYIVLLLVTVHALAFASEYKYSDERKEVKRAIAAGDSNAAIRLLTPFADKNDADAQGSLGGRYYSMGDYKNALKWFKRASKNGDVRSLYNIGLMYEKGNGVDKNISTAHDYYVKAAKKNNPFAMNRVGELYYHGIGNIPVDKENAIKLWMQAADQNFIPAMKNMCKYSPRYLLSGPNKMYCDGE